MANHGFDFMITSGLMISNKTNYIKDIYNII